MEINFKCKKCRKIFDTDVGKISIDEKTMRPIFSKGINCPKCGKRTMDEVTLTELGQSQLTEAR
jgi:DNA-directed RNA polymerase subunit RPC12/RpoP